MRKFRFLSCLMSVFVLGGSLFVTGCQTMTNDANKEGAGKLIPLGENEKMVADFETLVDCTTSMIFGNYFGRFEINTNEKYVTNGHASMKVNPKGDKFYNTGAPNVQVLLTGEDRDISELKRVTFDIYNDTDHEYEIGVYFRIGSRVLSDTAQTKIKLPKGEWTNAAMSIDMPTFSLCNDPTDANSVCIAFETCYDVEAKNDLYIDNLRFSYTQETSDPIEMALDENEFCSFDKLYQRNVVSENLYSAMTGYDFKLSINSDLKYSKNGKSMKMHIPHCPEGQSWGWPNIQFAQTLVKAADFAKYDENATFSFWVYNDSSENVTLWIDFWRAANGGKRSFGKVIYAGWNHVTLTFKQINEDDGGFDLMTEACSVIHICSDRIQSEFVDLYFDSFEIIPGN